MKSAKINLHFSLICLLGIALLSGFLMEALLFLIIICLHEFGHLFWIKIFGGRVKVLHLSAIGGMIELDESDFSFIERLLINLGGIIVNIGIFFLVKDKSFPYFNIIFQYNQLMLFFNLLPIYPLDGYRILSQILGCIYEEEYLTDVLFYFSLLGVTILFILAYLMKSLGLGLILVFLTWKCFELRQKSLYHSLTRFQRFQKMITKR